MNRFILPLFVFFGSIPWVFADEELDERLKAVMMLFDKKQQQLTTKIGSLELENKKLEIQLAKLKAHNQALAEENQALKKQLGVPPEKRVETASSALAGEALSDYLSPTDNTTSDGDLKTNVNVASQVELELLPGVGPVIAKRIIDNRPYETVDDLLKVRGIGKTSIEILRPLVRVE